MKARKIIYILTSAALLMLSSCMSMDVLSKHDMITEDIPSINGIVVSSEDGIPIEHIMVTVEWSTDLHDDVVYTSSEGKFSIPIHKEIIGQESSISITIEDIDGIENGGEFEKITDQIMLFPKDEEYTSDSISLDYRMTRATREENSPQA